MTAAELAHVWHKFPNGYGASVICNEYSYGSEAGLFELAVLKRWDRATDRWHLCYDTPITDDVIGWLNPEQVAELLARIEALPPA